MSGRGKLSFKGDKKSKKKSSKSKHKLSTDEAAASSTASTSVAASATHSEEAELTTAEKRSLKFKSQQAKREMEKVVKLSHRERVEEFNEKLGSLTELNDIPRVSAAGNG